MSSEKKYNWKKVKYFPETYHILEDADIVMAVFTAPMLYTYMFDFPQTAFDLYAHRMIDIEERIQSKMEAIRDNPEWYEAIVKQAKERGLTVEENLRRNAIYVLEKNNQANEK